MTTYYVCGFCGKVSSKVVCRCGNDILMETGNIRDPDSETDKHWIFTHGPLSIAVSDKGEYVVTCLADWFDGLQVVGRSAKEAVKAFVDIAKSYKDLRVEF